MEPKLLTVKEAKAVISACDYYVEASRVNFGSYFADHDDETTVDPVCKLAVTRGAVVWRTARGASDWEYKDQPIVERASIDLGYTIGVVTKDWTSADMGLVTKISERDIYDFCPLLLKDIMLRHIKSLTVSSP